MPEASPRRCPRHTRPSPRPAPQLGGQARPLRVGRSGLGTRGHTLMDHCRGYRPADQTPCGPEGGGARGRGRGRRKDKQIGRDRTHHISRSSAAGHRNHYYTVRHHTDPGWAWLDGPLRRRHLISPLPQKRDILFQKQRFFNYTIPFHFVVVIVTKSKRQSVRKSWSFSLFV